MYMKKIVISSVALSLVAYLYFAESDTETTIAVANTENTSVSKNKPSSNQQNLIETAQTPVDLAPQSTINQDVNDGNNDDFFRQLNHLTEKNFYSADQFTSAFLNEDGEVSSAALEDTFNIIDFKQLIERVDSIEKTDNASLRESTLLDSIYKLEDVQIYSESYSCAGKICLVSFDFEGNDENVSALSQFTSNYSFTNIVAGDNGAKKFKAVYIETDDPSTLRLSYLN